MAYRGYIHALDKQEESITCEVVDTNDGSTQGGYAKKINWSYKVYGLPDENEQHESNWIQKGTSYLSSGQSTGGAFTATGLISGTKYDIEADIWFYSSGFGSPVGYYTTLYGVATTKVGVFAWTYAGVNASGHLVQGGRKDSTYNLYLATSEWNRLVDIVRAKLTERNMYSESKYQLNNAYVYSEEYFTATKFNLVRFAIGSLVSTGLSNKVAGDDVLHSDLNLLMDKINLVTA